MKVTCGYYKKKLRKGNREIVEWLRGHTALVEDLSWAPSTHVRRLTITCYPSSRGSGALHVGVYVCVCPHVHTHIPS